MTNKAVQDPTDPSRWIVGSAAEAVLGRQVGATVLHNVHPASACEGYGCPIHHPSDHRLASAPLNWRDDRHLMERICQHGIGHPDADDLAFKARVGLDGDGVHGCDGCC